MAPLHNFILSRQLCRSIPSATRSSILRDLSHTRFASTSTKVKPTTPAALRYPASFLHSFRFQTTAIPRHATNPLPAIDFSAVNGIANAAKSGSRAFPETSSKSVAYWLLGSAASVFGIVIFGGLTRLTESGYVNAPISPNSKALNVDATDLAPSTDLVSPNGNQ